MAQKGSGYSLKQGQLVDNEITTILGPDIRQPQRHQNRPPVPKLNSSGYRDTWAVFRARQTPQKLRDDANVIRQMPLTRILEGKVEFRAQPCLNYESEHWIEMLRRHRIADYMKSLQRRHASQ